ncbi:MAG: type II secretion system minor pseudopilin GspI [Gammaproteobacteria bacterium]|nr:type II secretion system minor pseudopilin GspI [Gammaproteobacteria bacterium]
MNKLSHQLGFTLLEVLVALTILTIGLGATLKLTMQQSNTLASITDKTVANWVANNKLTELRSPLSGNTLITSGIEKQGGRDWYWRVIKKKTAANNISRYNVEVRSNKDDITPLLIVSTFAQG